MVTNRRELEYSASGLMGAQYPPEYVKHHIDRLHTPGALRLLDLELSGPDEILPGIVCEAAGGHTEGSMNVLVETDEGVACICGDIVYHVHDSLIDPFHVGLASRAAGHGEPREHEATGEGGDQEGAQLGPVPPPDARPARADRERQRRRAADGGRDPGAGGAGRGITRASALRLWLTRPPGGWLKPGGPA